MLQDNTFAAVCFNTNTIEDLEKALCGPADQTDMETWGLTEDEWRQQMVQAMAALIIRKAALALQ